MAWVKLDDQFARHPKVLRAGPLASWLHVCALTYCAQYATDGFVPHVAVNGLADFSGIKMPPFKGHRGRTVNTPEGLDFVGELIDAGMWEEVEDGYRLHDYLDYNPSREQVEKERVEARARMNKVRSSPELPPNDPNGSDEVHLPRTPSPTPNRPETITPNGVVDSRDSAGVVDSEEPSPGDDRVDEVYGHFKARIQPRSRLCPRKKIAARLKRFSAEELREGIDHFAADPWWMEHCVSRGAEWFFESDARAEQFLLMQARRPGTVTPIRSENTTGYTREQAKADFGYLEQQVEHYAS